MSENLDNHKPLRAAVKTVVNDFKEDSYSIIVGATVDGRDTGSLGDEFYGWCDNGCNTLLQYLMPVKALRIHFCASLEGSCKEIARNVLLIDARYAALQSKGYPAGERSNQEFVIKWWVDVFSVNKQSHLEKIVRDVQQIMLEVTIQGVRYP